jgi:putative ABC transport system permease protein
MLKHYLKIAFRSMINDKGYLIVNIVGLSVAVACCFLLIFWVKFELSYEDCYPDADRIYRVVNVENRDGEEHRDVYMRPGIVNELRETFPQIEAVTYTRNEFLPFIREGEETPDGVILNFVTSDMDFLKIFGFVYLEGSPQSVADSRGSIISKEAAQKMFGKESPVGKTITFANFVKPTIAAVVEMPKNTNINFDILNISDGSPDHGGIQYVYLRNGVKVKDFQKQIENFQSTLKETENKLKLQPIRDMHLYSKWTGSSNLTQIYLFSLVAFLILLIAVINYVNTSISRAINRAKEVALRKVAGSSKGQLIIRFLSDSFILSFISVIFAMVLVNLLFPVFTEIMGYKLGLYFDFSSILIAIVVCLIITVLAGGYAAFYLSSFSPMLIFRGGTKTGSKENLRKGLIGVQFFLSVGVLICTTVFYKQINLMFNADIGVERKNIIALHTSLWYEAGDFIQVIKRENPNIIEATRAMGAPFNSGWGHGGIKWEGSSEAIKNMDFAEIACDENYLNTFGLEMVAGRFFEPGRTVSPTIMNGQLNRKPEDFDIIINESFRKLMGEENPIGITLHYGHDGYVERSGKIIGIVKDFNFKPLKEKIAPLIISYTPEWWNNVYIKTTGNDKQGTLDYIVAKYNEMKPKYMHRSVDYTFAEEDYDNMYKIEQRIAKLFSFFSIISFVLSIMGVISMVAFMAEKRTKEIAIRKIHGARIIDIIALFIKNVLTAAVIATVIAIPIAYIIMNNWLQGYVYRTSLSLWMFVLIPVVVFAVVSAIIAIQIYFIARKDPVHSLRSE